MAVLAARPLWANLLDPQYGPEPALDAVVSLMRDLLGDCRPDAVFFPLGLFHSDHRLTRKAAMALARTWPGCRWFAYEDALYRLLPGLRDEALADLAQASPRSTVFPAGFAEAADAARRKRDAVGCYASQLRALARPGLAGTDDLQAPERYWRVVPAGEERP